MNEESRFHLRRARARTSVLQSESGSLKSADLEVRCFAQVEIDIQTFHYQGKADFLQLISRAPRLNEDTGIF